jgi:hypothetical protein
MRDIYEVITIATETGHDAIARAAAQQLVDLQEELAALKAENAKLRETAYDAIEYVAMANYPERVKDAHEMMNNVEVAK